MTTIHRRIGTPAVTGYKAKLRWQMKGHLIIAALSIWTFVAFAVGVVVTANTLSGEIVRLDNERDYLQSQLITAYADNNKAQAAMAATIDKVDHDSYWSGWYNYCVYDKGIAFEEACWEAAEKEMGK